MWIMFNKFWHLQLTFNQFCHLFRKCKKENVTLGHIPIVDAQVWRCIPAWGLQIVVAALTCRAAAAWHLFCRNSSEVFLFFFLLRFVYVFLKQNPDDQQIADKFQNRHEPKKTPTNAVKCSFLWLLRVRARKQTQVFSVWGISNPSRQTLRLKKKK